MRFGRRHGFLMNQAPDDGGGAGGGTTQNPAPTTPPAGGAPPTTPPATTPPAGGASPAPATAPGSGAPPAPTGWTADPALAQEDRDFIALKKYGNPADVVKALRNAQQFIGAPPDELVRIPKGGLTPEGQRILAAKLGVPEKPEGYQFQASSDPEEQAQIDWFRGVSHQLGLTPSQAVGIMKALNSRVEEVTGSRDLQHQASLTMASNQLRAEWGEAYQRRMTQAEMAVRQMGWTPEQLSALQGVLGPAGLVKFVYEGIVSRIGEDRFVTQDMRNQGMIYSPEAARARMAELKGDAGFVQRLADGKLTAAEKREWTSLHQALHPPVDRSL